MKRRPKPLPASVVEGSKESTMDLQEQYWGVYEGYRRPSKQGGVWKEGSTFVAIWRYLGEHIDEDWNEHYAKLHDEDYDIDLDEVQWERASLIPRISESVPAEVLHYKLQSKYPNGEFFQLQFFRPDNKNITRPASIAMIVYVEEAESELMKKNAELNQFAEIQYREKKESERRASALRSKLAQIEEEREAAKDRALHEAQQEARNAQERERTMENNAMGTLLGMFERLLPQQREGLTREDFQEMIEEALEVDDDDEITYRRGRRGHPPEHMHPYYNQNAGLEKLADAIDKMGQRQNDLLFKMMEMQNNRAAQPAPAPVDPVAAMMSNPIMSRLMDRLLDKALDNPATGTGQTGDPFTHPVFGRLLQSALERGLMGGGGDGGTQPAGIFSQITQGITNAAMPYIQKMTQGGTETQAFAAQMNQGAAPPALPPASTPPPVQIPSHAGQSQPQAAPPAAPPPPPPPPAAPAAPVPERNPNPSVPPVQDPPPVPHSPGPPPTQEQQSLGMLEAIEGAMAQGMAPEQFAQAVPDGVIDEIATSFSLTRPELATQLNGLWSLAKMQPHCGRKTRSLAGKRWIEEAVAHLKPRLLG